MLLAMDRSTGNESNDRTIPIQYMGGCGNPSPDGAMYPFQYSERAPVSLCEPHGNGKPSPDTDKTGHFMTAVIERHHLEILHSRSWRCVSCNQPAKELLHTTLPFLSPGPDALPEFEPMIWDTVVPICRSGGACDRLCEGLSHKFAQESLEGQEFYISKTCDCCGGKTGVKLCMGCKTLG
jgi:hypothetical protein